MSSMEKRLFSIASQEKLISESHLQVSYMTVLTHEK